jgi:succinate dehydrogenase/fumarate reductase flavoprotein subunit
MSDRPATGPARTGADGKHACDVLVIGSGAGGLAAAITARLHGLDVLVVEKESTFGGTTAWSGGWLWIPRHPLAERDGIVERPAAARTYLQHELGPRFDAARVDAFLEHGPEMVRFLEAHTSAVRFIAGHTIPDFHDSLPGAATGGRSICGAPIDGRELGPLLDQLRPPLREITVAGMAIAAGADLRHFMNATRSAASALHAARRLARYAWDLARYRRGMHLVNGHALTARLGKSATDLGVPLWIEAPARRLRLRNGAVRGAIVARQGREVEIATRRGVVLACGGFAHDIARRRRLYRHAPTGAEHWSAAAPGSTGDGIALGEAVGGVVDEDLSSPGAWAPVSQIRWRDGRLGTFPHLVDRARPGIIAVTRDGRRFVNEAESYHDFTRALLRATDGADGAEAFLVCDHRAQRRYGLGFAKPFPLPLRPYLRSGYLRRGRTLEELAQEAGINAPGLAETIAAYNRHARDGRDPEFGKGDTPFNRFGGDPACQPNPCLAPIARAPFYAVRILPGSLGTFAGLRTDARARVLSRDGRPIEGLYAVGNDMASVMGGHYPAGGITLGPAMTFGYLAGLDLAGQLTHARTEELDACL